ncbi:MAG: hypothetical protein ABI968_10315 [Acidobacteriota bacterium]
MRLSRLSLFLIALPLVVLSGIVSCKNNDTTTAPGAIASLTVDSPDTAASGQSFDVSVTALNIGVNNIQNGHVDVTFPAPLTVSGVNPSAGTTATFTESTVSWSLATLDANTSSILHVTASGTLPAGSPPLTLTITGTLTATGINAGDAVSQDTVVLNP